MPSTHLIITQRLDQPTYLIATGLIRLGLNIDIIRCSDLPNVAVHTIDFKQPNSSVKLDGAELNALHSGYELVWRRRIDEPSPPSFSYEQDDQEFIFRENSVFFDAVIHGVAQDAFWVNPLESLGRADSKINQTRLAIDEGFHVPPSLFSNSFEEIRSFINSNKPHQTIYKPFRQMRWRLDKEKYALLPTTVVTVDNLPVPDVLQMTPGIFQARIEKAFEVRATFMGADYFAVAVDSQSSPASMIDWRMRQLDLPMEQHVLPDIIYNRCRNLMARLGLYFGAFDFIVTPTGEYVFLEVNERGQFTWLEASNSDFPLCDMMVQFLASGDAEFRYQPSERRFRFTDLINDPIYRDWMDSDRLKKAAEAAKAS
ncbi:MAG: hypothetical protein ACFB2Z_01495 [Maricaulaceae bacterium]